MNRNIFFLLIIGLIVSQIGLMSADTAFYIPKGNDYCIKFSCENGGSSCSSAATCNISITYPNSSFLVETNVTTNLGNGFFQYCLNENETSTNGEYVTRAECQDGGLNDTSTFIYEVNPTGIRPSSQKTEAITRSVYFIFGIGILLFISFLFSKNAPVKWTYFAFAIIFWLISLNVLFVGLQDEVVNPRLESFFDSFTAISFIIYWFIGGLLILMWIFTFFNTYLYKKNLNNMRRFA